MTSKLKPGQSMWISGDSKTWVAAHDARKRAAGQKRVHIWVAAEHEATLRLCAKALAVSKHGAPSGLVKAAAWTPIETLDNLSLYTSGTIYHEPGPLIGAVPLYTLEALAVLMRGAKASLDSPGPVL